MKWTATISACCILLLAANVALIRQNQKLKAQISQPSPAFEAATGAQMPDLHGFDATGKPIEVLYGKDPRKALVLVFSPTCGFCDQNWPKWWQIVPALDAATVRPVAVDVTASSSPAFLSQHRLAEVPVFVQVDPQAAVSYRFHLTPQTILVDRTGKVEKVWTGVLSDSAVAEIKQLLGPGKYASALPAKHQAY